VFETNPAVNAPENIPKPIIKLLTPRYVPSNPFGMDLKIIIELETLKIENAETIKHEEIIATKRESPPVTIGIIDAVVIIPRTRGK
jgi:hypothetical protein